MPVNLFECHVVFNPTESSAVRQAAIDNGFSMSYITGDEDLGDIRLFYLTKRGNSYEKLLNDAKTVFETKGVPLPIRYKIEVTLLDVLKPERVIKESVKPVVEHVEVQPAGDSKN